VNIPSPHEGEGGTQPVRVGRVGGYSKRTLNRAKSLRRELSDAEKMLWRLLRSRQLRGAKFRRQQPIGPFIADFVCQQHWLIVEADGGQHAESIIDDRRTAFVESKGYRVLRFWNNDIFENEEGVLTSILNALQAPLPNPSPAEGGRGLTCDPAHPVPPPPCGGGKADPRESGGWQGEGLNGAING